MGRLNERGGSRTATVVAKWLLVVLCFVLTACSLFTNQVRSLPPILTQEQLERPYVKVGVVHVSRERYGSVEDLSPADYDWANQALREEAQRIGADAIIFPELRVDTASYLIFPASEISATATAIKFR
jgi:hypothetical protein